MSHFDIPQRKVAKFLDKSKFCRSRTFEALQNLFEQTEFMSLTLFWLARKLGKNKKDNRIEIGVLVWFSSHREIRDNTGQPGYFGHIPDVYAWSMKTIPSSVIGQASIWL